MHRRMSVLVTGGAGFIGSHLVDRLVDSGYDVRVIDNLSTGNLSNIQGHIDNGKIEFVKGDIKDAEQVKKCVHGVDAVLHLAAVTSVPFSVSNPTFTYETNVNGTINLLAALAHQKVGKFVFISSCAVYGEPQYLPVDEKHPANPISPYADSKLLGEYYSLGFHENKLLKSVALRFFNVYGLRQGLNDYSGVITKFVDKIKQGSSLTIYGDGSQTRDFVHVSNIVDAIMCCLENEKAEGQIFNVGSGKATSIEDLAKTLLKLADSNSKINHEAPRQGDIKHSYANASKLAELLNYRATKKLDDGLHEILVDAKALKPQKGRKNKT